MNHDDITRKLSRELPSYFPSAPNTENYNLLASPAELLARTDGDVVTVERATDPFAELEEELIVTSTYIVRKDRTEEYRNVVVEAGAELIVRGTLVTPSLTNNGDVDIEADGEIIYDGDPLLDRLAAIGDIVGLEPKSGERLERYRARLIAEFQLTTNDGTANDIITTTAEILDVDKETIGYFENDSGPYASIDVRVGGNAIDRSALTQSDLSEILDRMAGAGISINVLVRGTFTYITPTDYNGSNFDASLGYDGLDANGDPKDNGGTYAGVI
jgi:hypothetical protein